MRRMRYEKISTEFETSIEDRNKVGMFGFMVCTAVVIGVIIVGHILYTGRYDDVRYILERFVQ